MLGTHRRTESNRSYQEAENSSLGKKHGFNDFNPLQHVVIEEKHRKEVISQHVVTEAIQRKQVILKNGDLSPETPKRQKRNFEFLMKDHLDVRGLLASNYLYGLRVKYIKDKVKI